MRLTSVPLLLNSVETLATIRRRTAVARLAGSFVGASGMYSYLKFKKRKMFSIRSVLFCFGASVGGSILFTPIGLVLSLNAIKKLESPQHMVDIMAASQGGRRQGQMRPQSGIQGQHQAQSSSGGAPSMDPAAQTMSSSPYPPAPTPIPASRRSGYNRGPQTNQWGDEVNGPETSYSNDFPSAASTDQYSPSPQSNVQDVNAPPSDNQSQSRWAQLRGQRGVQESSWERIRQQKGREAYNRQSANGQGRADQSDYQQQIRPTPQTANDTSQSGVGMADPIFGKGVFSSRAQAQQEYERSFERERRGVDG